ncbi:hypothetical protein [Morganella morganii]|uniref:hypothetical protein n=1 Tax=Morganella morganii TaxID=582 RepID=UPI003D7F2F9D
MLRRKTKSVERQGWRDPSEQGCDSVFSFCVVSAGTLWQNQAPGFLRLPNATNRMIQQISQTGM